MIYEILDAQGNVENKIEADQSFVEAVHPGRWRLADIQPEAPQPLPEPRRLAVLAFRRRFTRDEKAAIEWAAVDRADLSEVQRQQAAALRADLADQAAASYIDLDDVDVINGVQNLESFGLITVGRANEILNSPVLPGEMP